MLAQWLEHSVYNREVASSSLTTGRCGTVGHVSRDCRIANNKTCHKCGNLAKMCRTKIPGLKPKVHDLNQFSVEEESETEDDKHPEDNQNDSEDPEYVWTL